MRIMSANRVRHLPVVEDEKVVGIVSIGDLVNWIISAQADKGTSEEPKAPVFVDGRLLKTLKGDRIVAEFIEILDDYVASRY